MKRSCSTAASVGAATLLLTALVLARPLGADERILPDQADSQGPLDGMAFRGTLGPADDHGGGKEDTVYFRSGHFWSALCVPCGFRPGRYWVHRAGEAIHFRGTLHSPESGSFRYTGVVEEDGRIVVSIDWHKERWYWTINREFRFEGELRDTGSSFATLGDARDTATSALEAGDTCEPG